MAADFAPPEPVSGTATDVQNTFSEAMSGLGRVKLRHLQCLVAIAAHRHMGRAAESLCISQPAISKTLTELESLLDTALVVRSRRGAALTEKGLVLLGYAGSSLRTLREGLDQISSAVRSDVVTIAIGTLPTVASTVVPLAVQLFKQSWPAARLSVRAGVNADLLALLKRGELDLVLGRLAEPAEMQGLSYEHFYEEELVLVARPGHPLAVGHQVEPAAVLAYPMVIAPVGTAIRHSVDLFFLRHGLGIGRDTVETVSDTFSRAYVCSSQAVWVIAIGVVEEDLRTGRLVRLPCVALNTRASVGLTLRSDVVPSRAVRALLDSVRQVAAQRAAGARPS